MKKAKTILSVLIAGAMIFSVSACANSGGAADTAAATSEAATTAATTTAAAATTEAATTEAATTEATAAPAAAMPEGDNPILSPDKPITLSAFVTSSNSAPAPDNKLTKLIADELGVTISYDIVTPDNVDQKIGVMLAGGDYPDLVGTTDLKMRLLEGGALLKLDDYLNSGNYPNLSEYVGPYYKRMSYLGTAQPHGIYIFPNFNRYFGDVTSGDYQGAGFFIQKRVLEDAGYPDLSNMTLDKYFGLIENYLAKNPTTDGQPTIGFESADPTGTEWIMTNPAALLAGSPNNGGVIVDANNVAAIYADKQVSHDWIKYLNAEFAKGVVDPESFTQTADQYLAKLATGRVLGMHDQAWHFGQAKDSLISAGQDQYTYVATMPVYAGATPYYADRDVMNLNQGFGVSVSSKQPEAALAFLDTMLSERWQKMLNWGFEGDDYSIGPDGMFTRSAEQRANATDITWMASNRLRALNDCLPKHNGQYSDGNAMSPNDQPSEFFATLHQYDQDFLKSYNKQTWRQFLNSPPDNPVYYPCWNIGLSDAANEVNQQLTDAAVQYLPAMIMDTPDNFESNWAAYLKVIGQIDVKTYEDEINAGIQQRIADWQ
jgi:putative aldouronate transport system substrate-binding protein